MCLATRSLLQVFVIQAIGMVEFEKGLRMRISLEAACVNSNTLLKCNLVQGMLDKIPTYFVPSISGCMVFGQGGRNIFSVPRNYLEGGIIIYVSPRYKAKFLMIRITASISDSIKKKGTRIEDILNIF